MDSGIVVDPVEAFCTDTVAVDTVVAVVVAAVEDTIVGCILDDALDRMLAVGVAHSDHSSVGQIRTIVVGDPEDECVAD